MKRQARRSGVGVAGALVAMGLVGAGCLVTADENLWRKADGPKSDGPALDQTSTRDAPVEVRLADAARGEPGPSPDLGKTDLRRPDAPVTKPDAPVTKPDAPVIKPDLPVIKPDLPPIKPDAAPLPAPLLYLKLNESSGTTAVDSSGSGNNAKLMNGPAWVSGKSGNALTFDGVNDYADLGVVLDIYSRMTITAWIRPTKVASEQSIVCKNFQTSYQGYELGIDGGELKFRINPSSTTWVYRYSSGAALSNNTWQHIGVVYDESKIYFYKNGALVSSVTAGGRLYSTSEPVYLGVYFSLTSGWFSGALDELRIYDKSLSSTEMSRIYALP